MKRVLILTFCILLSFGLNARNGKPKLDVKTQIDSVYVFGFDLRESRSAKGGIWNIRTGKPETPLNYTQAQNDTIDSLPVVRLYRQVVPGNHPLNGWEIWARKDGRWICIDSGNPRESD